MNFDPNIEDINSYMWQYRQACKHRDPFSPLTEDVKIVFIKLSTCNVDLNNFHIGDPWMAGVAYIDMCINYFTPEFSRLCAYNFATLAIREARNEQQYQLALPLRVILIDKNWNMYESVYREFVEESLKNGYEEKANSCSDPWKYPSLEKIDLLIMSDIFACKLNGMPLPGYSDLKDQNERMYRRHYMDFSKDEIIRYGHRLHELFYEFMIRRYNPCNVFNKYGIV